MTTPPVPSLETRIAQRITADGSAIVPPRIARWIETTCRLTADRRMMLRTTDPDAYVALTALHLAALRSENGTEHVAAQQNTTRWISTTEAAQTLGVTDRCIRKWCTTSRLHAQRIGGRWLINPHSLAHHHIA